MATIPKGFNIPKNECDKTSDIQKCIHQQSTNNNKACYNRERERGEGPREGGSVNIC